MVLNNPKPYDSDSSAHDDEEPWEMIGEYETETTPLAATAQIPTAVTDHNHSNADGETNAIEERESQHESEVLISEHNDGHDGNLSLASGVSSITGDHHTVSEVDDEESLNGGIQEHDDDDNNEELDSPDNVPLAPTTDVDSPEKKDEEKFDAESDPLVEQLLQMGFEKDQIEKAIGDLREAGATEIDADSVIGSMVGENNQNNAGSAPLSGTWDFVEANVQDLDRRHQLRQRTQNCMRNFNQSAQDFWSNVRNESQQFRSNLRETCDQADVHARNATTSVRFAASSAKDSVCRANEQYRITEKLATVAVVGGATLLALGNPRAGVGAIAVAGATLAAGEAMKQSSAQSTASRDYGLNEDLHLD